MKKFFIAVFYVFFTFSFFPCSGDLFAEGFRDKLEGLVYEVEDWTEPKDAWVENKSQPDKWMLWNQEKNGINVRSNGQTLRSPIITEDRKSPEEGAPVLHTKITDLPKGIYNVYCGSPNRPLAYSFDGGKSWLRSENKGEEFFGTFEITNGIFEVWVDDRFAEDKSKNQGASYYDYIRFVQTDFPVVSNLQVFTLPNGKTQISWITSKPSIPAKIVYTSEKGKSGEIQEDETGMRNHAVVFPDLQKGEKYVAELILPLNRAKTGFSTKIQFRAGDRPEPGPTRTTRIRLRVDEPTDFPRENWPLSSGVPFAKGILASTDDVRIVDEQGKIIPAQFESFCTWPDGSIKWLLCDFRASTQKGSPSFYYLETEKNVGKKNVLSSVDLHSFLKKISSKILLADGTELVYTEEPYITETEGAIRTTLKGEGSYQDRTHQPKFRWRSRISFYGSDLVRIQWTTGNDQIQDPTTLVRSANIVINELTDNSGSLSDGEKIVLPLSAIQTEDKKAMIQSGSMKRNTESFDGFLQTGSTAWYLAQFRETWPKGLSADQDSIVFSILPDLGKDYFPDEAKKSEGYLIKYYWLKDGCYLYKRGLEIRQDIWLLRKTNSNPKMNFQWMSKPLFAVADPEYYCSTGTFPPVNPIRKGEFDLYEKAFETSFHNLEKGRKKMGEYGWMNYGDWFGERTWNWGDNEYDLSYTCALQFIRSGNLNYLRRGAEMAIHYSSVDFKAYSWDPKMRELMYRHCAGHINGFFDEKDPRVIPLLKDPEWKVESDGGGHAYHPGNYYIGCLIGDKRIFEVGQIASWNQAKRYTPKFNFGIERAAGWALNNAVYSYNFTGNPYYLNAADIYFEKILEKQNKETGCFDMKQNSRECDCPDKLTHKRGKAFAVGILLHALIRYNEVRDSKEARDVVVRSANWLLDESWNEEAKGFRYKTGCPKFANSGWYTTLVTEGIGFAGDLTGDPRYIEFLKRTLGPQISKTSGSSRASGKIFSQMFLQMPHTFYYLQKAGITNAD